jgi:hypothetical protein
MMTALRANSVYDWASRFLAALAGENEAGEFDKPMDQASIPEPAALDRLGVIGPTRRNPRLDPMPN